MVNLYKNAEFDIKKEIVCALSNATCGATNEQIKYVKLFLIVFFLLCFMLADPTKPGARMGRSETGRAARFDSSNYEYYRGGPHIH
jgi:hypothetical protein